MFVVVSGSEYCVVEWKVVGGDWVISVIGNIELFLIVVLCVVYKVGYL